ncbi:MAG TPA: class I SAM-dependent methyltransferase [Gemmatimonas sp.]|uniref:class I SAM-dependent methyltransferase n=1 Tax=Gemmatimonas sp. TaxID=1962908 RepID=UPI002ED8200D
MSLEHTQKTYEKLGREDPFYAVLTDERFRHNRWDVPEFFATGEREVAEVFEYIRQTELVVPRGRALDFGCGVGRLTQALATRFDRVTGVDIAESMAAKARELNQHGGRVEYFANAVDNLRFLDDRSFDFVYSSITLQHVPPPSNVRYVEEFLRILRPGGVAVFQVPNGREIRDGSWQETFYKLRRQYFRRAWKIVRGKPPYEMHYIPRCVVERTIAANSARLVDTKSFGPSGRQNNFRYFVIKH